MPAWGKAKIKRLSRSSPPVFGFGCFAAVLGIVLEGKYQRILNHNNTQQQRIKNGANFASRYIEMRMRRVYLSMRTEGIKAFSKRIQRGRAITIRKRYVDANVFENGTKQLRFRLKTDLVSQLNPASDRTDFRRLTLPVL